MKSQRLIYLVKTGRKKHSANNTRSEAGENAEGVDRVMQLQNSWGIQGDSILTE